MPATSYAGRVARVGQVGHVWTPPEPSPPEPSSSPSPSTGGPGAELAQQVLQLAGVEVVGQPELGEQLAQLVTVEPTRGQLAEQRAELADVQLAQAAERVLTQAAGQLTLAGRLPCADGGCCWAPPGPIGC